jgi:hypothetical protein
VDIGIHPFHSEQPIARRHIPVVKTLLVGEPEIAQALPQAGATHESYPGQYKGVDGYRQVVSFRPMPGISPGDHPAVSGFWLVFVGVRGVWQPCNIMVHKAGILDEKAGNCLSLTGKYPGLTIDQSFSAEDDRLPM